MAKSKVTIPYKNVPPNDYALELDEQKKCHQAKKATALVCMFGVHGLPPRRITWSSSYDLNCIGSTVHGDEGGCEKGYNGVTEAPLKDLVYIAVQPYAALADLAMIEESLKSVGEKLSVVPREGDLVHCVYFDGKYRRCVIMERKEEGGCQVRVYFVDYGSVAWVERANLRTLPPWLCDVPPCAMQMATRVRLANCRMRPEEWNRLIVGRHLVIDYQTCDPGMNAMQHFRGNVFVYQDASSEPIALESIAEVMGERKRSMLLNVEKICASYAKQIYERALKSGREMVRERMVPKSIMWDDRTSADLTTMPLPGNSARIPLF